MGNKRVRQTDDRDSGEERVRQMIRDSGEQKGQTDDQGQWGRERQMTGTVGKRETDDRDNGEERVRHMMRGNGEERVRQSGTAVKRESDRQTIR